MTIPIDTTRLRADTEAVRDAGVKSAYAHHVVKRLVDAGHSDLTSARKDARDAAETLRGAQKRLYRDAPPDGIILALLDEVERLRAMINEAGEGTFNVVALLDLYHTRATDADERAALAYPRALQAAADVVLNADVTMAYLEILAWVDDVADAILDLTEEQIEGAVSDAQKLASILAILRAAVASGDARARVLADVEEVARG